MPQLKNPGLFSSGAKSSAVPPYLPKSLIFTQATLLRDNGRFRAILPFHSNCQLISVLSHKKQIVLALSVFGAQSLSGSLGTRLSPRLFTMLLYAIFIRLSTENA